MSRRDEIAARARELLGATTALMGLREYGLLARMLDAQERIAAMALGRLRGGGLIGSQRLVVVTTERVLLVEKGFITGRERTRAIARDDVRGVVARPPTELDIVLDGETIALHLLQPPRQIAAIAEELRGGDRTAPTVDELTELGRRKLGRVMAYGAEPHLLTLAGLLGPDENVLALGFADGLLAATTERLVFVPNKGFGVGEVVSLPYGEIERAEVTERQGIVAGALELDTLIPAGSAETIVQIVRARRCRR